MPLSKLCVNVPITVTSSLSLTIVCVSPPLANGGDTQTIVNEREDVTVMGTFTHNFDNGIQMDARLFYYEDTAYLRSNVSRYVSMGDYLDPVGILSTVQPNNLVPIQFGQQLSLIHI